VKRTCYAQASQIRQVNLVLFSHLCVSLFDIMEQLIYLYHCIL
jgi:hypothetical protein